MALARLLLLLALALAVGPAVAGDDCHPASGIFEPRCNALARVCAAKSMPMKWTGSGCTIDGAKQNDGGCQCEGYCGYRCASACTQDRECAWQGGACRNRATGELGAPILQCGGKQVSRALQAKTLNPTKVPSKKPTAKPTQLPSRKPSRRPTFAPSAEPTPLPTKKPTAKPTKLPTRKPTVKPTEFPTVKPTKEPTLVPSRRPSLEPTTAPSKPTRFPTTARPTLDPTPLPTEAPTNLPTPFPTSEPTNSPTQVPTAAPTNVPTQIPTAAPTNAPTLFPTAAPTNVPTLLPTAAPTQDPTAAPTNPPTPLPTAAPTNVPTAAPTDAPTQDPTAAPTNPPTPLPTAAPSQDPTAAPTKTPTTLLPTSRPTTLAPTTLSPTPRPTTLAPTRVPTRFPTSAPTRFWVQQGNKLLGSGSLDSPQQGYSVAMSANGTTVVVGAVGDNSYIGAAWIYTRLGSTWSQQGTKLVGSGFTGDSTQGYSVSISADGNTVICGGAENNNSVGAAWVFNRSGSTWTQHGGKLVGTGFTGADNQGYSVALSGNGTTAIVGGPNNNNSIGAAWIFVRSGSTWSQQGSRLVGRGNVGISSQGISVAISTNGSTAIVGGFNDNAGVGAAWIFTRSGSTWSQQGSKLVPSDYVGTAYIGRSVSLSSDGNTALVGGRGDAGVGAVWIFVRSGSTWSQQGSKLTGSGGVGSPGLGFSASLSADGNTAFVGGPSDDSSVGAAWTFTRSGSTWSQQGSKLVGTGAVGSSGQGYSVSISGDAKYAIVGGMSDNSNVGASWVFQWT